MEYKSALSPAPVYEASFDNGEKLRMSFYTDKKKPIDPRNGERLIKLVVPNLKIEKAFVEHPSIGRVPVEALEFIIPKKTKKARVKICPHCKGEL